MTRSTALIIALVIAGGVAAAVLLVNGGGGSGETPTIATTAPAPTQATIATTTSSAKPENVQAEAAVTSYVSAAEEGDATAVCDLQLDGAGSGATSAQACASKVGINLNDLPALAKLNVQEVRVSGDSATVRLGRFGEFTLRRSAGQWKVAGFRASTTPSGSSSGTGSGGESSSSSGSGTGSGEQKNSGGVPAPSGTGGASAP